MLPDWGLNPGLQHSRPVFLPLDHSAYVAGTNIAMIRQHKVHSYVYINKITTHIDNAMIKPSRGRWNLPAAIMEMLHKLQRFENNNFWFESKAVLMYRNIPSWSQSEVGMHHPSANHRLTHGQLWTCSNQISRRLTSYVLINFLCKCCEGPSKTSSWWMPLVVGKQMLEYFGLITKGGDLWQLSGLVVECWPVALKAWVQTPGGQPKEFRGA